MTPATLDINVLLSSVLGPHGSSRRIIQAWAAGRFTHVTSDHIITGFEAKLTDAVLIQRFPFLPAVGRELLPLLRSLATIVPVPPPAILPIIGDTEDDTVLATARLGRVAYLVTGDHGLLALGSYEGIRIVTPRDFLAAIQPREGGPG
jgi:putative PIN family toxin of toxin-antitoxin system